MFGEGFGGRDLLRLGVAEQGLSLASSGRREPWPGVQGSQALSVGATVPWVLWDAPLLLLVSVSLAVRCKIGLI